ncbi:MAG: hypothetical protein V4582_13515 [Pseudomonadota bacterium]
MDQRYAKNTAKLALALALGLGAGLAVQHFARQTAAAAPINPATLYQPTAWQGFVAPVRSAPVPARLDAHVLVAGDAHNAANGRIALPDGTRFQLRIASSRDGMLEVHAVNPYGVATGEPVWSGHVRAGSAVVTPMLRLEGARGLETLRLQLRAADDGAATERKVQIWHL